MWLYSVLPDSLPSVLFSGRGLRSCLSGLEIGRPATLIPSEETRRRHAGAAPGCTTTGAAALVMTPRAQTPTSESHALPLTSGSGLWASLCDFAPRDGERLTDELEDCRTTTVKM
ncbi:hypothetical protein EYF80_022865 [Liparis tanakae]|uniref:Uncharacterized protein n=1 Tax=Liparis tanakae TaxID=230148 RepID=A0A4Z2HM69_9TELE|nr:hypothetical protein EYF80_022865 [Liparis tanakae]